MMSLSVHASYELQGILHNQTSTEEFNNQDFEEDVKDEVSTEEIQSLNPASSSIDDLLKLSDVATTSRGPRSSSQSPQVRGLDDNKIYVMIDGARQNFQTGHTSMIAVDTENLKAVDIYKSSASLANAGSLGGGVNFVTKDASDFLQRSKKSGAEFKTRYNSANAENGINAKYIYREKNRSGYISASQSAGQNLRLNDGTTMPYSAYEDKSVLLKNKVGKFGSKLEFFERKDNAPLDPSLTPPDFIPSLQSLNTTTKGSAAFDYTSNKVKSAVYFNRFELTQADLETNEERLRRIDTIGLKLAANHNDLHYGGEVYQDELTSEQNGSEIESYPRATGRNYHLFGEKLFKLKGDFDLTTGLRMSAYDLSTDDLPSRSESALTRKLKVSKRFGNLKTFATYSEGFNAPRVNEVYPGGLHSAGDDWVIRDNFFIPNEDLRAETSATTEFGLSYDSVAFGGNGLIEYKFNAYNTNVKNYIFLERIDRSVFDEIDGTTQFMNIPSANLWGGETSLKVVYDVMEISLSYSKVRGRNQTLDLYLQDLPADQYNFKMSYFLDKYRLNIGYIGNYALEQNRTNPETIQRTDSTPSYLVHNLYLTKQFNAFNIDLRADNVTNTRYRRHASFLPEATTNYRMALTYKINTF